MTKEIYNGDEKSMAMCIAESQLPVPARKIG